VNPGSVSTLLRLGPAHEAEPRESDTLYIRFQRRLPAVLTRTYGDIVKAVFHELGTPNMKVQYVCTEEGAGAGAPWSPA